MRKRRRDIGGRFDRERGGSRADVNKRRSGASTALTISGILGSGARRWAHGVPRSGERARRRREHSTNTITQDGSVHALGTYVNIRRPVLHYVHGPRRCSLRHRIPLPTDDGTRRERATTSRCSVHLPAPRLLPPRPNSPARAGPNALPRARPTSGESRTRIKLSHRHEN